MEIQMRKWVIIVQRRKFYDMGKPIVVGRAKAKHPSLLWQVRTLPQVSPPVCVRAKSHIYVNAP